jgi:hypothetical protein
MGIMALVLQAEEVVQHRARFVERELINAGGEGDVGVYGLQTGDGVGANERVNRFELAAEVVGRASRFLTKLEAVGARLLAEAVGVVGGGETGEKPAVGGGETIIRLVVGGPEGTAKRGER